MFSREEITPFLSAVEHVKHYTVTLAITVDYYHISSIRNYINLAITFITYETTVLHADTFPTTKLFNRF